jgi:hypothetical protein
MFLLFPRIFFGDTKFFNQFTYNSLVEANLNSVCKFSFDKSLLKFNSKILLWQTQRLRQAQVDSAQRHIEPVEICAMASAKLILYLISLKFKQTLNYDSLFQILPIPFYSFFQTLF